MAESLGAHYRFVKGGSRRLLRFPRGGDAEDQLMSTPVDQSLTDIGQRLSRVPVLSLLNEEPTHCFGGHPWIHLFGQ